jgi:hypothetical protein
MFVHTILQALNRDRRPRPRKLTDPIYPEHSASDAANVRTGLVWFFVVVLAALSFALL